MKKEKNIQAAAEKKIKLLLKGTNMPQLKGCKGTHSMKTMSE